MRQSNGGAAEDLVSHCKDFSLYPEWISNSGAGPGMSSLSAALRIDAGDKAGSREEEEAIAEAWGGDAGGLDQGGGRGMVSSGLTVGRF